MITVVRWSSSEKLPFPYRGSLGGHLYVHCSCIAKESDFLLEKKVKEMCSSGPMVDYCSIPTTHDIHLTTTLAPLKEERLIPK